MTTGLTLAARVHEPTSGRVLEVYTTEPASSSIQVISWMGPSSENTATFTNIATASAWRHSIFRILRIIRIFPRPS